MWKYMFACLTLLTAACVLLGPAKAQTSGKDKKDAKDNKETVIHVEDLDCEACAEVVSIWLQEIPEVDKVKIDVDEWTATVTPKANQTLSPKLLWEAVETSGFVPTKLVGPSGTFTKKPSS